MNYFLVITVWFLREFQPNPLFTNPVVQHTFPRYLKILQNEVLARYLIAKQVTIEPALLKETNEKILWDEHDAYSVEFQEKIQLLDSKPLEIHKIEPNYLDLKIYLANKVENPCRICERKCERERSKGEVGFCLVPDKGSIASAFLHYGEEPVLIPSGTIFFNGCTFRCVFCQNWDIAHTKYLSNDHISKDLTFHEKQLSRIGARNLNYVGGDPSPNIKTIFQSWTNLNSNITQLFNSNHFLSLEGMKLIEDIFDFWLPDFKYWDDDFAFKHSKVKNYRATITRNLKRCFEYGSGEMIIRHLVLPGRVETDTKPVLKWIKDELDPYGTVMVNIMAQYHPDYLVPSGEKYKSINRRVTNLEIQEAFAFAKKLNLKYEIVS